MRKNRLKYSIAIMLILSFVIFRIFFFDQMQDNYLRKTKPADYKGIISVWDISATTISGSQYGFIQTVCDDFSKINYGVMIDLYKIPEISTEETIALGMASSTRPDVIRYKVGSFEADKNQMVTDEAFMKQLSSKYQNFIINQSEDKLVIDVYYNISVIIVNTDILNDLGVQAPSAGWNKNEFIAFLSSIQSADSKEKFRTIDFSAQSVNAYLPFALGKEKNQLDVPYLKSVIDFGEADIKTRCNSEVCYDFYNSKTAVFCGDLKNVNYLLRQQIKGKGFNFKVYLYPSDSEKFVFVNDIVSYSFLDSGDENRNEILKNLAEYMLSYDALKYTENLGMLPCVDFKDMKYEKYPHLAEFNIKNASYYTIRDNFIIDLTKDAPSWLQ